MDDDSQSSPLVSIKQMQAELALSKQQAALGQGRSLSDVIAQMKAKFRKDFPNSDRLKSSEAPRRKIG